MADMKEISSQQLVKNCVLLDRKTKKNKKLMDGYKAELQARGLAVMEDQNIKYVKFYAEEGTAAIADSMTLETLNPDKLKEILGEGLFTQKVKETVETKYKYDTKLEKALKAVFMRDYTFECTLEEFMDEMSIKPDEKQRRLLLKKLKGDYAKDKETLLSVFGFLDETDAPNFDVELWYIYRIKNAELIRAFLPEEEIDATMAELKKYIIVDTKTSITIDYEEE